MLSQHIDRSVMAEETLVDVLKNLSASYPPESIAESSETMPGTLDSTKDRRTSGVKKLSIPSLCLQHKPRATEEHRSDDRKHTEEYAAGLLARRLTIGTKNKENPNTGEGDNDLFYTETFESVKDILLQNINESFATLVDCRLRAYATFLARHGLSLARKIEEAESVVNIEQKLTLLLDVGNQITAPQAELHLHVNDDVEPEVEDGEANLAISLEVRLSLEIPRSNESVQVVPVSITSPGEAKSKWLLFDVS